MTAAPLGAPLPPTVDPTAQQSWMVAQVALVMEFTGVGSATVVNEPVHGDPPGGEVGPGPALPFEQAAITTVQATSATTVRARRRAGVAPDPGPGLGEAVEA